METAGLPKNVVMEKLRAQVEDVVAIIMDWHDGYFRFEEMELPADKDLGFSLVTENVIMEVSRRLDEWSKIRSRLPDLDQVLVLSPGSDVTSGKLDIKPEEWLILASIDGRRTARQVIQSVGGEEFDTAKVIYGLIATGLVRVTGRRLPLEMEVQSPKADPLAEGVARLRKGEVREAIDEFSRILQLEPDNPGAHLHLGEAYYQSESYDEAVMEFKLASQGQDHDPEINYLLGYTYAKLGRLELAVERWEKFLAYAGGEARAGEVRELVRLAVKWAESLEQRKPTWTAAAAKGGRKPEQTESAQLPAEAKAWLERMRSARPARK
jgi:thioredoxin-like negative regulator of GroEL